MRRLASLPALADSEALEVDSVVVVPVVEVFVVVVE